MNNVHTILFKAYLQDVPDATFHDYMRKLQDDWMDQAGNMKDMTHEDIMQETKAKHNLLMNSGKWDAVSQSRENFGP